MLRASAAASGPKQWLLSHRSPCFLQVRILLGFYCYFIVASRLHKVLVVAATA